MDLYGFSVFRNLSGHRSASPLQYGLAEVRTIMEGAEVVLGFKLDKDKTLNDQKIALQKCSIVQIQAYRMLQRGRL